MNTLVVQHKILAAGTVVALLVGFLWAPYTHAACGAAAYSGQATLKLTSAVPQTVPGAQVGLTATLAEAESLVPYILAVTVTNARGATVDRFVVSPQGEAESPVVWSVPLNVQSGVYTVHVAAVPEDMSYVTAFTDTSFPSGKTEIAIVDGNESSLGFSDPMPLTMGEEPSTLVAAMTNDTDVPYKGSVTWQVRSLQSKVTDNPLLVQAQEVKLHPRTATKTTYSVPNVTKGTYYLEARMSRPAAAVTHGWLVDGVFVQEQPCSAGTNAADIPTGLIQAIALIAIVGIGAVVWGGMYHHKSGQQPV